MNKLVSIVVITYNSSPYIIQTLESISKQTYSNIELIITDDCSSDSTIDICKQWISSNKYYFVSTKVLTTDKNHGVSANCNRGIKASNGEFIKIIAGDDILHPECIHNNVNNIKDSDLLVSQLIRFSDNNYEFVDDSNIFESFCALEPSKRVHYYARTSFFFNTPTLFYRASLFNRIGYFIEEERILEDVPFLIKVFNSDLKVSYMPIVTVYYRQSGVSNNSSVEFDRILLNSFFKYRINYLNKKSIIDNVIIYERRFYSFLIKNKTHKNWYLKNYYKKYNIPYYIFKQIIENFKTL